jgi:uncharacterized membrane-anchored protein YhcB (DUF1043 family)
MTLEEQQKQLEKFAENSMKQIEKQKKELENHLATSNPTLLREMQSLLSKAASGEMSLKEIEEWYKKYQK